MFQPSERRWAAIDIEGIIFDLDNTLLNRKLAFRAYSQYFVERYVKVKDDEDAAQYAAFIEHADQNGYRKKRELYEELHATLPMKNPGTTPDHLLAAWFAEFSQFTKPMDGALRVLTRLRENGCKLGLVTNGSSISQHAKIDNAGIRDYFDAIIVSDDVQLKKPAPAIFHLALERLSVPADRAVYIGDHPINDIQGAISAGLQAIWLRGFMDWPANIREPAHSIGHLDELIPYFQQLSVK